MKKTNRDIHFSFLIFLLSCLLSNVAGRIHAQVSVLSKSHSKSGSVRDFSYIEGKGAFTTYTSDNGLALDVVYCSSMDHFGNIWFGTQGGGVSRYDGKTFVTFTTAQGLASNSVWSILEDKSGNMWFCTNGGVSKYDGKRIVSYNKEQKNSNVWCIAEDNKGNLWWGTSGNGVIKYNGTKRKYTTKQGLANNSVKSILKDKKGNLWIGTAGGGVSKYDGKTFVTYTTKEGLADNYVNVLLEDKQGNIWMGGKDKGVSKFDGKVFVNYTVNDGLPSNSIRSICQDKTGILWLGTNGGGVCRFDEKTFVNYTTTQGLANNSVCSILEDKSGNIWFCTNGGGVSKYEGNAFSNFTTIQGMPNSNVWSITEDKKGNLWLGTDNGASCFNGYSFKNYALSPVNKAILSVMEDKTGSVWLGTYEGGVYRYDGKKIMLYTIANGLPNNTVRAMYQDTSGNIWFATDGGASCYDGKSFTNYNVSKGLADNLMFNILQDKSGKLWFATNSGISCFDGHSFKNYTTAQGLADNAVYVIMQDKNECLWFGTQYGLSCLTKSKQADQSVTPSNKSLFQNFTTENGLPDNYVTQVVELSNGKIVVGTNLGIALFSTPHGDNLKLNDLELFNTPLGYPVKDVNVGPHAMFVDSKGIIWISTGSDKTGLVRFDYSAIHPNSDKPYVVIQNIKIGEENIPWECILKKNEFKMKRLHSASVTSKFSNQDSLSMIMSVFNTFGKNVPASVLDNQIKRFDDIVFDEVDKFYPIPKNLVLPYNHNQITFDFTAIEPSRAFLVNYQYILEGYSKSWSPVSNRTDASFGNIDEGTYTFKLKAQSPQGTWSVPVTYTFRVLPPWWRTWWMYLVYSALTVALIVLITLLNTRRLRLKAKELRQKVTEATEIIMQQKHAVEEINKHITDSIDYAQRIQNAILPEKKYINSLFGNHFIYFQPKESVSGDFYWFGQKDNKIIFATVDCTGHGVPGALMSMIGNTLLNEIINGKGITESDEILNDLRKNVIHVLKQKDGPESQKDGMDIAVCVLDKDKMILEFSGAHHSLYHFREGILNEIKGDKQAIGYVRGQLQAFTKNTIEVRQGDTLYLFTDGFVDQKGYLTKKKFYYTPFRELLTSIQHESMFMQEEILRTTFNNWKRDLDQVDDVLVIGIKL